MKIGIGIIGLGYMGNIFTRIVKSLGNEDCELIGVADTMEDRLKEITNKFKCEGYKDYKKLVNNKRVNLVYIATPPKTHLEMIKECVENNKNILCEKPLVVNISELQQIEMLLKNSNIKFQIGLSHRFNVVHSYVKEIIESDAIGKVEFIRLNARFPIDEKRGDKGKWLYDIKSGGGTILEGSIHYWDLAMWLTNSRLTSVYGKALFREYDSGEYDYISTAIGELENGVVVNVDNIFSMPKNFLTDRRTEIIGDKGIIYINQMNGPLLVCSDQKIETDFIIVNSETPAFPDLLNSGSEIGSYRRELLSFINCIKEDKYPMPDFNVAKKATYATHSVLKSVRSGEKVSVDYEN